MAEVLHDRVHTARVAKRCDQCSRQIEPGQRYRKQVHTYDGFQTYRAHEDCDAAADRMKQYAGSAWNADEYATLSEDAHERDDAWIKEEFPAVAARLWPARDAVQT